MGLGKGPIWAFSFSHFTGKQTFLESPLTLSTTLSVLNLKQMAQKSCLLKCCWLSLLNTFNYSFLMHHPHNDVWFTTGDIFVLILFNWLASFKMVPFLIVWYTIWFSWWYTLMIFFFFLLYHSFSISLLASLCSDTSFPLGSTFGPALFLIIILNSRSWLDEYVSYSNIIQMVRSLKYYFCNVSIFSEFQMRPLHLSILKKAY